MHWQADFQRTRFALVRCFASVEFACTLGVYAGVFFFIHSMCNVHVHEHCSIVQCTLYNVQCSHSIISSQLSSSLTWFVQHFFSFCLHKIECFSAKTCCGLNETKRNETNNKVKFELHSKWLVFKCNNSVSIAHRHLFLFLLLPKRRQWKSYNDNAAKNNNTREATQQYWHENAHFTCTITRACKEKRKD